MQQHTTTAAAADGLMIVEAASFTQGGRLHLDSRTLVEGTRDLLVGERIVIMAAEAPDSVVEAWQGFGWTVVRRDPLQPIYKMPSVAKAIAAASRVVLAANVANFIGAVPALRQLNKRVVAVMNDARPLPGWLTAMLVGWRSLPEATFVLPPAIGTATA